MRGGGGSECLPKAVFTAVCGLVVREGRPLSAGNTAGHPGAWSGGPAQEGGGTQGFLRRFCGGGSAYGERSAHNGRGASGAEKARTRKTANFEGFPAFWYRDMANGLCASLRAAIVPLQEILKRSVRRKTGGKAGG
jgi:hypothetical protein